MYVKKRRYLDQQNYIKKVRGNNVDFSINKITSKKTTKARGNLSKFGAWRIEAM